MVLVDGMRGLRWLHLGDAGAMGTSVLFADEVDSGCRALQLKTD